MGRLRPTDAKFGASLLAADSFAPIFADEPTSGLDSYQARRVTTTLRECADMRGGGRVVVLSIHQPSWTILENIDDVVLLGAGGSTLYTKLKMLETLGAMARCPRPLELSPAEWALEIASVDPHNADESKRRVAAVARPRGAPQASRRSTRRPAARIASPVAGVPRLAHALIVAAAAPMVPLALLAAGDGLVVGPARDAHLR